MYLANAGVLQRSPGECHFAMTSYTLRRSVTQSFHVLGYPATQVFERAGPIADPMYHNSGQYLTSYMRTLVDRMRTASR